MHGSLHLKSHRRKMLSIDYLEQKHWTEKDLGLTGCIDTPVGEKLPGVEGLCNVHTT